MDTKRTRESSSDGAASLRSLENVGVRAHFLYELFKYRIVIVPTVQHLLRSSATLWKASGQGDWINFTA